MTPSARPHKVVLVDDYEEIRAVLREVIEAEPSLVVVAEAGDLDGAWSSIAATDPDLIIMDEHLPPADLESGAMFIARLATLPRLPRIIGMSAAPCPETRNRMLLAGANAFFSKGDAVHCLIPLIKQVLQLTVDRVAVPALPHHTSPLAND